MFFFRFTLTETDRLGGLPSDLSLEEGKKLKEVKDLKDLKAAQPKTKAKATKPKTPSVPQMRGSKTKRDPKP